MDDTKDVVENQAWTKTHLCMMISNNSPEEEEDCGTNSRNIDEGEDMNNNSNKNSRKNKNDSALAHRREFLQASSYMGVLLSLSSSSSAFEVPSIFTPPEQRTALGIYKPAKRACAYLVDSTMPPTLVPFRASREAAILKTLGSGLGTSKDAFYDEGITFNNVMNKAVFGTIRAVQNTFDLLRSNTKTVRSGVGYASFVFFGVNYDEKDDVSLSVSLLDDIMKPRRGLDTALGLAFIPQSAQSILDTFINDNTSGEDALKSAILRQAQIPESVLDNYMPLFRWAKDQRQKSNKSMTLLALAPELDDIQSVRRNGLEQLNSQRRLQYVMDTNGFVQETLDPKFQLYTEKSLLKDYTPITNNNNNNGKSESSSKKDDENVDGPADFFAERILVHEAIATSIVRWALGRPDSLVVTVAPIADVRFMHGPNGRIPRIAKYMNEEEEEASSSKIDEQCVTTILLNPSAEETLSKSRFLRLEIGTTPDTLQYQTKIADYLWFSSMPKVNMIPRLMNIYGTFQ